MQAAVQQGKNMIILPASLFLLLQDKLQFYNSYESNLSSSYQPHNCVAMQDLESIIIFNIFYM